MPTDESSSPGKKKKTPRSSKKKLPPPAATPLPDEMDEDNLLPLSKFDQNNFEQLLMQSLLRYKNDEALNDKKDKLKEVDYLSSIVQEYLSCFVLVGFSLQNEKVCIFNAQSSKDEGALVDYLRSTFLEIANNRP